MYQFLLSTFQIQGRLITKTRRFQQQLWEFVTHLATTNNAFSQQIDCMVHCSCCCLCISNAGTRSRRLYKKKFLSTITTAFPRQLTLRFLALDARDINIIINTHDKAPSGPSTSSCEPKNCFTQCEDGGAIGGVCDDSGCHCQYGLAGLTVQVGLTRGSRLAPTEEKCDLDICNKVCYQKGGFAGGVCDRYGWQTQP